jgi:hypothetical protein
MKLGFGCEAVAWGFCFPDVSAEPSDEMDGQGHSGFFEPRQKNEFPAQAQVAAWARGGKLHEWLGRWLLLLTGHRRRALLGQVS